MSTWRSVRPRRLVTAAVVIALAVAAVVVVTGGGTVRVSADFASTNGLFAGNDVRVLGVKVGSIDEVRPERDHVRVEFHYDDEYSVPADATAVIVAPALVTSRYLELSPGYSNDSGGDAVLADGAHIPVARTAVPVEFDEIKTQLNELTTALGPQGANRTGSVGRLLDVAAQYEGQGQSFHDTIEQVSQAMRTLSDGRDDLFGTVRNLQVFVSALAASDDQIVQFTDRLSTVSGVLADNSDELATALSELDTAAADVEQFVRENRSALTTSTEKLADVARMLSSQRPALEQALHVAPTTLTNFYNIYDPLAMAYTGAPALVNLQTPAAFVCSGIGAATATTPVEAGKLCADHLGPLLNLLQMNYVPVSANPLTRPGAPTAPTVPDTGAPPPSSGDPGATGLLGSQTVTDTLQDLLNPRGNP